MVRRKADWKVKILLIGAGGVGGAFTAIAARRDFFESIVVADFDLDAIRSYRRREVWGNAFRRPSVYANLSRIAE